MPIDEQRIAEIERKLEILKDHEHNGVDFKKINADDIDGGSSVSATMYLSADSSNSGSATKVALNTSLFTATGITLDTTNNRFTITKPGKYLVSGIVYWSSPANTKIYLAFIYKNNAEIARSSSHCASSGFELSTSVSRVISLSAGDYVELWADHNNGANSEVVAGTENYTVFSIAKV